MNQNISNKEDVIKNLKNLYSELKGRDLLNKSFEEINSFVKSKNLGYKLINNNIRACNQDINGYSIEYDGVKVFFPIKSAREFSQIDNPNIKYYTKDILKTKSLLIPPFMGMGEVYGVIDKIYNKAITDDELFYFFNEKYNLEVLSQYIGDIFLKNDDMKDFCPVIEESVKAFCVGLNRVAIISLIPCIEGILRKMYKRTVSNSIHNDLAIVDMLTKAIESTQSSVVFNYWDGYDWYPDDYMDVENYKIVDVRIQLMDIFKDYIKTDLFISTDDFNGADYLNRHGILHGLFDDYDNPLNFYRLILILCNISFCCTFSGGQGNISLNGSSDESIEVRTRLRTYAYMFVYKNKIPVKELESLF